jgi:hypothetical protein
VSLSLPGGRISPLAAETRTRPITLRLHPRHEWLRATMTENDQPNNFELQNISVPGVNKIANNEHHNRTQRDNSSSGIASYLPFNFNLYNNYQHQQGDDQASRRGWIQQSSNHDRQPQTPERDDGAAKGNTRAKNTVVGPLEQPNWPRRHWRLLVFLLLMLLVIPGITAPLAIHFENRSNDKGSRVSTLVS